MSTSSDLPFITSGQFRTVAGGQVSQPGVAIGAPSALQMVQDNWVAMHTPNESVLWWNICFADGHAKFTRWIDFTPGNATKKPWQGPWGWNFCNPQQPIPVDQPLPAGPPYR